jgi:serralysin
MSSLTRRSFVNAAAAVALVAPAHAENSRPAVVDYQSFQKQQLRLRPYVGRNVVLLLDPAREPGQLAISRMLEASDRAWDWYKGIFGRTPALARQYAGKATIAEVSGTCGAGCGLVGFTGIEVAPRYAGLILDQAARDLHFQLVFYELGRNFFFYREPLGQLDALISGFAHVNRFCCMDAIGVMGGPWGDGLDWEISRHVVLVDLLDRYLADAKLTWRNTIAEYKAPENPRKWDGAAFAASLYYKIRRDHGSAGYRRFWQLMAGAPKAATAQESVERFVQIAHAATGEDYRRLLRDDSLALAPKTIR